MIDLLMDLIAIESVSGNEVKAADYVRSQLAEASGSVSNLGNIVIWKNEWDANRKTIALGAHLDTVPFNASDWLMTHPTQPLKQDGKVYGRGACDMKAGAAIILDLILKQEIGNKYNVLVFWYDKEELGIPNGITTMLELDYFKHVDLCIIPEPTACRVNYGVFGNLDAKIIGHGKAAHSSMPQLGRNAIYELIPVLEQIRDFPTSNIAGVQEAISVNIIEGGNAINVLPDKVVAKMDYRFDPNMKQEEILLLLDKFSREHVTTEVIGCFPGVIHDIENHELLKSLIDLVGDAEVVPFWSDIGQLGAHDIIAVNFGPGHISQAHTADEFVPIEEMEFVRNRLKEFLN